jgi:HEAT repeat protein
VPAAAPPATAHNHLRQLVSRYVESDGAGGWRTNEQAATELEKLGPEATAGLVSLLADQQVAVRRGAAFYLLGSFNANDQAQVQAFSALLGDDDQTIRGIGLSAARKMRAEDQAAAVPRLAAMLDPAREDKPANREAVARLLAGLKTGVGQSIEQLAAAAAGDPVPGVRSACLIALAKAAEPRVAAPLVAKGLADKDAAVRLVAAVRLRQIGAESAPASPELAAALADSNADVRAAAAETLVKVGKPAIAPIATQLATGSLEARKLALYCLAKIGPPAKSVVPQIEKCLADSDAEVKKLAAAALASIRESK